MSRSHQELPDYNRRRPQLRQSMLTLRNGLERELEQSVALADSTAFGWQCAVSTYQLDFRHCQAKQVPTRPSGPGCTSENRKDCALLCRLCLTDLAGLQEACDVGATHDSSLCWQKDLRIHHRKIPKFSGQCAQSSCLTIQFDPQVKLDCPHPLPTECSCHHGCCELWQPAHVCASFQAAPSPYQQQPIDGSEAAPSIACLRPQDKARRFQVRLPPPSLLSWHASTA